MLAESMVGLVPATEMFPLASVCTPGWLVRVEMGLVEPLARVAMAGNLKVIAGHSSITIATPPGQTTPASPTGDVFNIAGTGFNITSGGVTASSRFIFATEDGTISGWNASVNSGSSTVLAVDNSHGGTGAVYKGLAIGTDAGGRTATAVRQVLVRGSGPTILILDPPDGFATNRKKIDVSGAVVGGHATCRWRFCVKTTSGPREPRDSVPGR